MPLSDREQAILEEIERSLRREDPGFARDVDQADPGRAGRQRVKVGIGIFFLGLVTLVGFFVTGFVIVGVIAFSAMVGGIVIIAGGAKALLATEVPRTRFDEWLTARARSWQDKLHDRRKP